MRTWAPALWRLAARPSVLTSEYTVHALKQAVPKEQTLTLLALVDWDPAGAMIAQAFQDQLEALGPWHTRLELLITPRPVV